jgi:hypothetical protein
VVENRVRKDPSVYEIVENDLPIPEEYLKMDIGDLYEGIRENRIPLVCVFYCSTGYTVYYPGKEPATHQGRYWHHFIHTLKNIGDAAIRDGYPVFLSGVWEFSGTPRCKWCGAVVEKPSGKTIPFCADTDCRNKYLKFRDLLKKLSEEGKISEFERDVRMNSRCIIDDTLHKSRYLIEQLQDESEIDGCEYPGITRNFIVTPDLDIVFADKICVFCGASFAGNKQARFCSDTCRYRYHNEKKRLRD